MTKDNGQYKIIDLVYFTSLLRFIRAGLRGDFYNLNVRLKDSGISKCGNISSNNATVSSNQQ